MTYNMAEGLTEVYLSYAAYCGTNVGAAWNCYWCKNVPGFTWVGNFGADADPVFGYVGYLGTTVYAVFRGTDNGVGWITDFNFPKIPYPISTVAGAEVHEGFYGAYQKHSSTVQSLVTTALSQCGSSCSIRATGHSLGAALAELGALDLSVALSQNVVLYNFGQPRVGNTEFATFANTQLSDIYRMVWKRDPVPHVPPAAFGFQHSYNAIWQMHGKYNYCGQGNLHSCSDTLLIYNVVDHGLYMNVDALDGTIHGCLWTDPGSNKLLSLLNSEEKPTGAVQESPKHATLPIAAVAGIAAVCACVALVAVGVAVVAVRRSRRANDDKMMVELQASA